ncbi:hypothetical protein QEG98_07745 [Myxococcus sp. MxC21-1]|uniref:hypothetical protein n=1 Tax=Myxococcus sp. MxC21-1 TaxID=3041439 RepID=UPI00292DE7B9|nr:hypothetical protein [Myxococcus sp. MxC21-1]WNZ63601.1 hypothetical protein QEG98_07745 [Myxococcus sp. MxC21-1]
MPLGYIPLFVPRMGLAWRSRSVPVLDFTKAGWLLPLLTETVAFEAGAPAPSAPPLGSGRARARAYLRRTLRASGLLYGTPADAPSAADVAQPTELQARVLEDQLFHAVVRTLALMALELGRLVGTPTAVRTEHLLVLFAVLTGELELAETVDAAIASGRPVSRRLTAKVEASLVKRSPVLAGDPVYGLVLHNGAQYADAQLFCRQAIDYFSRGALHRERAQRRLDFAARQKALLVDVLTGLACVDRVPGLPARRAILRQVESLRLPAAMTSELKAAVKQSFARRRPVRDVVRRCAAWTCATSCWSRRCWRRWWMAARRGASASSSASWRRRSRSRTWSCTGWSWRWRSSTPATAPSWTSSPCRTPRAPWVRTWWPASRRRWRRTSTG